MRAIALALLLGGCSFHAISATSVGSAGDDSDAGGPPADAYVALDGPPLISTMPVCLGTFNQICVDPPTAAVTLTDSINTDNIAKCAAYTSTRPLDACVIAGTSITIDQGKKLIASGNKKLVLFATTGDIAINGTLDAASHMNPSTPGAGADIGPCTNGTGAVGPQGGGYGGTFGGAGGTGGTGASGGVGGIATSAFDTQDLRGGCAGGDGQGNGGNRGRGGGAVYLLAKSSITIGGNGTLNASGAAGDGGAAISLFGASAGAGGGGGSGGMIVFEATTVTVSGRCFATGGGGGGGGAYVVAGRAGSEPTAPAAAARGGAGGDYRGRGPSGTGGDGGDGSAKDTGAQSGATGDGTGQSAGGGGGAGGGDGYIKVIATNKNNIDDDHVYPTPR